jgi:Co/Zn/Cd efflux system component
MALVLAVNTVIGFVAYFIAFLMAYGFEDHVTAGQHLFFLTEVVVIVFVCALISRFAIRPLLKTTASRTLALALVAGATLNLVVVGIGSIISATHKAENSVSANFSTTTDVLVAVGLFAPAIITAWLTWHLWPRLRTS